MILVLSQARWEITTEEVQDWIEALGGKCVRLNGEDLNGDASFTLTYGNHGVDLCLRLEGSMINLNDIGAVWMRRWHTYDNLSYLDQVSDHALASEIRLHLVEELRACTSGLDGVLRDSAWLSLPRQRSISKLEALRLAATVGLEIPATLITNDKRELQDFKNRHGRIVTKSASEGRTFTHCGVRYTTYTVEVDQKEIDDAPERFFPSLLQELLLKDFEIRTFFLAGSCYSMAIFSQLDSQTSIDFRHYNSQRPNRMIPYRLPPGEEESVRRFMRAMSLETGSLDIVRTKDGRHVFLEVNPVGQFKMVSEPCNYRLEKKVAEYLMMLDKHARH